MKLSGPEQFLDVFNVSRETIERLRIYEDLLKKWNPKINLVARGTLGDVWARHFADSAQISDIAPENARIWVDMGSGGGFPGAVLAIMNKEKRPEAKHYLVESDKRKAAFLRAVARETGADFIVSDQRAEDIPPYGADVVTARALAPLEVLVGLAGRHLAPHGVAILPKGANVENEIETALALWRFDLEKFPSVTDPSAAILKLGDIRNA